MNSTRSLHLLLIFYFLGLSSLFAQQPKFDPEKTFSMAEIERRATEKYIQQNDRPTNRFKNKDITIATDDTINYNILLNGGDLLIKGIVNGDVLVILGDIRITSTAVVNGNVTAINGKIRQEAHSVVTGNQIETNLKNLFPAREFGQGYDEDVLEKYLNRFAKPFGRGYNTFSIRMEKESDLIFRYNRVQGVFLGLSFPEVIRSHSRYWTSTGFLGYGFSDKKIRYEMRLARGFFNPDSYRFELGVALYDKIDSKDKWLISPLENTLAAFLLNDDYLDYYHHKGYEFFTSQRLALIFKAMFAYRNDQYSNVVKTTDWAVFKDKDRFPENPAINVGRMRSLYLKLSLDTRNDPEIPTAGWYTYLTLENSTKKLKSDFSFNQYIFELTGYQALSAWEHLNFRLKVATSEGQIPLQKRFSIGGISTLRGFNYRSVKANNEGGDRLLLLNVEYIFHPKLFHFPFFLGNSFRYIIFFDLGNVWNRADVTKDDTWYRGFNYLHWSDLKSDLGFGLSNKSGRFRLNFAKRLDTSHKAWKISFRIAKPF